MKNHGNHQFIPEHHTQISEVSALIIVCLFKTVNSGEKNKEKEEIITKQTNKTIKQ